MKKITITFLLLAPMFIFGQSKGSEISQLNSKIKEAFGNPNTGKCIGCNKKTENDSIFKDFVELKDRRCLFLPKPKYNGIDQGIVIVEIYVNREGKVVDAVSGVKKSTTKSKHLIDAARKASRKIIFNENKEAPICQKGYVTYKFEVY